jgi:hypothetical protein
MNIVFILSITCNIICLNLQNLTIIFCSSVYGECLGVVVVGHLPGICAQDEHPLGGFAAVGNMVMVKVMTTILMRDLNCGDVCTPKKNYT